MNSKNHGEITVWEEDSRMDSELFEYKKISCKNQKGIVAEMGC